MTAKGLASSGRCSLLAAGSMAVLGVAVVCANRNNESGDNKVHHRRQERNRKAPQDLFELGSCTATWPLPICSKAALKDALL